MNTSGLQVIEVEDQSPTSPTVVFVPINRQAVRNGDGVLKTTSGIAHTETR